MICKRLWFLISRWEISDIHPTSTLVPDDVSTRYINVTCGDAKKAKYEFIMESGTPDKYDSGIWWVLKRFRRCGVQCQVLSLEGPFCRGKKAILYIDDKQLSLEDKPVEIELKKGLTDCVGWWCNVRRHIVQYGAMYSAGLLIYSTDMYRLFLHQVDVWLNWLNGEVNISSVWTTSAMARTSTVVCLISMERKPSIPILTVCVHKKSHDVHLIPEQSPSAAWDWTKV